MPATGFLFGDTFDGYPTSDIFQKWTNLESGILSQLTIAAAAARNGSGGLKQVSGLFAPNHGGGSLGAGALRKTLSPGDPTTICYRFAFQYKEISTTFTVPIAAVYDNVTSQVVLSIQPDGRLIISLGSDIRVPATSVIGTSSAALLVDNWYHIKWLTKINNVSGETALWINAVNQISRTGIDTQMSGAAQWTNFICGSSFLNGVPEGIQVVENMTTYYDDLNVRDDDDGRFDLIGVCLRALTGNGANVGYTPLTGTNHGDMVKDINQDGDLTVNTGTAVGQIDTYNMEDLVVPASIAFIQTTEVARKTDAGDKFVANALRIGATNYIGPDRAPNQVYSHILTPYDKSPATAAPFTFAEINAMESGQKVTG